jgi:hypothetical protein
MKRISVVLLLAALAVTAMACTAPPTPTPAPTLPPTAMPTRIPPAPTFTPTPTVVPLSLNALKNAEYPSEYTASKKAKLTDGAYEEKIAGLTGASAKVSVKMLDLYAVGDLNGDGVQDAAVILASNTGGSGVFHDLYAVLNQAGQAKPVASTALGDRVKINAIAIQGSEIVVDMLTQGPKDPMSNPTLAVTRKYKLQGDQLVSTTPATPTPAVPPTKTPVPAPPKPIATATPVKPPMPKGSIAYHWNDSGIDRMSVVNVETGGVTPYLVVGPVMDIVQNTSAHIGEWSPDGSKFAYIFAGTLNASNDLRILDSAGNWISLYSSAGGLSSPTWSPDGTRVAFARLGGDQRSWSIIIINADGTKCTSDKQECLFKQVAGEQYRGGLSWSKQGVFAVGFNTTGANDVHTMYSDGSNDRNLTNNPADDTTPVWSSDGKMIAFASNRDGLSQIYVMNADGSGVRRVSQGAFSDFSPTWSPGDKWIAFASTREGQTGIYMMDLSGNYVTRLTKTGGDHPVWSR